MDALSRLFAFQSLNLYDGVMCNHHHNYHPHHHCNDDDDDGDDNSPCEVWLEIELLESDVPTRSKDDTIGRHSSNDDDEEDDGDNVWWRWICMMMMTVSKFWRYPDMLNQGHSSY